MCKTLLVALIPFLTFVVITDVFARSELFEQRMVVDSFVQVWYITSLPLHRRVKIKVLKCCS